MIKNLLILLFTLTTFISCTGKESAQAQAEERLPAVASEDLYLKKIQPIFNARCIACHSCYNSPCQLDLTSFEAVQRGASHINIYDFPLVDARPPTRMGIDAQSTDEWRKKEFFTVLNPDKPGPSILVEMIRPKKASEQKIYQAETSRMCIDSGDGEKMKAFFAANPNGTMPFGFPGLSASEFETISNWVREGAKGPSREANYALRQPQSEKGAAILLEWEKDFNGAGFKSRLTARYIYEHLFAAHITIEGLPGEFYRLIRAKNEKGEPIEIPTVRPYDDAGPQFYYRFKKITSTIVAKTNLVYKLDEHRRTRWKELFYDKEWLAGSDKFPEYGNKAANAFVTFVRIPADSRYRFLLDDAYYHIGTFIKGPVCRGQRAVNVINDHFWVMFLDPNVDIMVQNPKLHDQMAQTMYPPASAEDEIKLFKEFRQGYWQAVQKKYAAYEKQGKPFGPESIWNGDRKNPSALLTVYRHFDSAQVLKGAWGETPDTVWVIDYQVFEDIYYNLVAGYNVFGPVIHQLNTRLYMDISRIASEDMFLNFLPKKDREPLRKTWYRETPVKKKDSIAETLVEKVGNGLQDLVVKRYAYLGGKLVSKFETKNKDSKAGFVETMFKDQFSSEVLGPPDRINQATKDKGVMSDELDKHFAQIAGQRGAFTKYPPDVALIRVRGKTEAQSHAYTLVHNKAHFNVSLLMLEDERRDVAKDTLNVVPGFATSYPNMYIDIDEKDLGQMVENLKAVKSEKTWNAWVARYAKSRRAQDFWALHDWFNEKAHELDPVDSGYFDLNRYGSF